MVDVLIAEDEPGILESLDTIQTITGENEVNAIGYCVGGTLLSYTLAYMAAVGDTRVASATLFATQVDFTHAGDLKVFIDEEQIEAVEKKMSVRGYLEGKNMSGVTVATTIRSSSSADTPAMRSASLAAAAARSLVASFSAAIRRCRIPVRVVIHSSEVSTIFARSSFVSTRCGM